MSLSACGNAAEVRYKVTVEVDDNGRSRAGSSVWSFAVRKPTLALVSPYDAEFHGEAVAVDLGEDRVLFALLVDEKGNSTTGKMWPELLLADLAPGPEDRVRDVRRIASHKGLERTIPRFLPAISDSREPHGQYPLLVRFRDIRDPATLEAVDPAALDKAFGPGVALKEISLQIVDRPVTTGIENRLPWLKMVGKARGTLIPDPPRLLRDAKPVQMVSPSDFSTELYKQVRQP